MPVAQRFGEFDSNRRAAFLNSRSDLTAFAILAHVIGEAAPKAAGCFALERCTDDVSAPMVAPKHPGKNATMPNR